MANTTINFNPAKFAGGVAKSFASATTQVITSYMPFTSEVISDISFGAFNVTEFINENRPDRNSRNGSTILKSITNKTIQASKSLISDLSYGDLSFESARNQIGTYLSKNSKSEFDFGFDDDFDFDFEGGDDDNSEMPSEKGFTVDDFAEGIYAATSSTVNAIEASYKNTAIANAKSNQILGDRLIANNMASMSQTMQMFDVVNKNISGVNANLASLIEYNNTTMNDFIKNTTTHFAKVEAFMDEMIKHVGREKEEEKKAKSNKIFEGTSINMTNLLKKGINLADTKFMGGNGAAQFIARTLGGIIYGDKMPKFLEELYTPTDFGQIIKDFNPMELVVSSLFPELGKLKKIDNLTKTITREFKKKLTGENSFLPKNKFGEFLKELFNDEDDWFEKYGKGGYKNKNASWTTSDSQVIQNIIPTAINETNNSLYEINSNLHNMIKLMEMQTTSLNRFHEDSLKYFDANSKVGFSEEIKRNRSISAASYKKYSREKAFRGSDVTNYRRENAVMFNAETGVLENVQDIYDDMIKKKAHAYQTGADKLGEFFRDVYTQNGARTFEEIYEDFGGKQKFDIFNDAQAEFFQNLLAENVDYHITEDTTIGDLKCIRYDKAHTFDKKKVYEAIMLIASEYDVPVEFAKYDQADLYALIEDINDDRKEEIEKVEQNHRSNIREQNAAKSYMKAIGKKYDEFSYLTNAGIDVSKGGKHRSHALKIQSKDEATSGTIELSYVDAFGAILNDRNHPLYETIHQQMEDAIERATDAIKDEMHVTDSEAKYSRNKGNYFIGALLSPIVEKLTQFTVDYVNDESNIRQMLSEMSPYEYVSTIKDRMEDRAQLHQGYINNETGRGRTHWLYPKDRWGYRVLVDEYGKEVREEEDPEYLKVVELARNDGAEENDEHIFVKYDDEGNEKPSKYQYHPGRQYYSKPVSSHATGATRIDKDKLVKVHKGEMILDAALSEDVRADFEKVLRNGGFDKLSDTDQKKLLADIENSNEKFKGKSKEVINAINNVLQKHESDLNGKVNLSDQSVCFIDIDPDDSPTTVMMKTLSEISMNLKTMLGSAIGEATEEEKNQATTNLKGGLGTLFGSFNKEDKTFNGGLLSNKANDVADDIKYWLFKNVGGFSYRGKLRDEYGNVVEGDSQFFKNGEDNPDTITHTIENVLTKKASEIADEMGLPKEDKDRYIGSIKDLIGGVKGAGKGFVAGLAIKSILGMSLGPAFGLIGGFAMANKTTQELILGAEATDEDGHKYRFGGIFSGLVNKFTELGEDIKTNFLTTAKEVGRNLRDATTMFIDKLIDEDRPSIMKSIISGVRDASFKIGARVTDVIVDAANIGSKLVINAAKIPFNMAANLIGGKEYRKNRMHEKWIAKDSEAKAALREFALYQRETGGFFNEKLAGLAEWDLRTTNNLRAGIALRAGLAANAYNNANTKFMNWQDNTKEGVGGLVSKIGEKLDFLTKDLGFGIKSVLTMIPAAGFLVSGNIPAALAMAGISLGNTTLENLTGTGLAAIIGKGVQLLGARIGRGTKKMREGVGNFTHMIKRRLGIKDDKFYIKRMTSGSALDDANMLGDLGIEDALQDEYYAWVKGGRDESGLSAEQMENYRKIDNAARTGLSTEDSEELTRLKKEDARYKELSKKKNRTPAEEAEFKALRNGKKQRRASITNLNHKANLFQANHGINEKNYREKLEYNAENRDMFKARTNFKNTLYGGLLTKEMFADENISDEELARRQKEYNKRRADLQKRITSKFGSSDDAFNEHREEILQMIMADEYVGKSEAALKGKSIADIKKFVFGNSYTDQAINEGKGTEQKFKDRITGDGDSIFSFVKQTKEDLKNMLELFKTWINTEKKEKPIGDKTSDLGEGSSRSEVAEMYGFDVNKLKNGDEAEKARFAKAQADGNLPVDIINAVTQAVAGHDEVTEEDYNQYASGATNIPRDQVAKLHAGEAVLDAETAKSFRSGAFGIGSLGDTLSSLKSGISDLVTVFKGNKNGSDEEKKSFLDKMKESFTGVGDKLSSTIMGSGLIPLTPLGKPDIAKIGARLVALLGGVLVLGPIISKVADKLKPIFEPLWEGITSAVKTGVETVKTVIYDMAGVSSFQELMHKIGAEIHIGWKNIGKYSASQSINKANTEFGKDKTAEHTIANRKTIETNIKASGSDMNFSDYTAFCNTCQRYFEAIIEFGKFAATEASLIQSKRISNAGTAGGIVGVTASVISYAAGISKPQQGIITRAFESQLTSSEKQYINSSVAKNSAKLLGPITGNWFAFESANMMSDFCQVIKSETGVQVTYEDNAFVADTNTSAAKIQRGTEIMNTRIGILNTLRNTGGGSTSYFADQFKSQIAARQNEINAANMTTPTATTTDDSAGQGIGYGYTQNDPRWSNMGYGRFKSGRASTMGAGGCGPTAMSNVYSNLTGRSINPAQMARFSQANGYNAQGGTSAGLFTSGARKLGLRSNAISKSGSSIGRSIRNGNNVIIAGKNGPYTKAGHIMSVRGVDGFGNAIVDDPLRRGSRRIPMNKLTRGMTHAWSIGNGEGVGGDQGYSTWSDIAGQGTVTFNPNGGAFGYNGPDASMGTAHSNMKNACIYNSFINGYINAALGNNSFQDYVSANGWSPYSLLANGETTQYDNDDGGVKNYGLLMNDLINKSGLGEINWYVYPDDPAMNTELLSSIKSNLEAGNPILFSVNNGKNDHPLSKITSSYNNNKVYKNYSQHGVLLAGLQTIGDMQYVLIDNPARTGNNQLYRMPIADFENGVLANDGPYIHRLVVFNRGTATGAAGKTSLATKVSNASNTFANIYAKNTGDDNILNNYNIPKSSSSSNSSGLDISSLLEAKDHDSFADYLSDLISRFAQLGSNMFGAFLTRDTNGLTAVSGGGNRGGGQNYSGNVYSSGLTSTNGSLGVVAQARTIVEDSGQIAMFLSEVRQFGTKEINEEISKKFSSKFIISESTYKDLTNSKYWAATLTALSNSTNYWKNANALNTNKSYSHVLLYTWVMAIQTEEYAKNKTSSTVASHSGTSKEDTMNTLVNNLANSYYTKINSMAFTLGTPHNDYYLIDNSFKDPAVMNEIPGGVGGGNTLSASDVAKVHQYMMDIITTNETGANKSDPDYINKAYFTPHWLSGENNITMGRIGFYDSNAAEIFNRAMGYASMPNSARSALDYLYKNVKSRSLSPSDVTDTLNAHPEIRPYIMSAEDAMTNEFAWDYIKRALGQYQQRGLQDPRSIILGAEFAGVSPASVPNFYSAVTNPGAADELDQVRQGMFNTIAGFTNYSKYGKGWKNRINGMYNALTTANGYNDHTGKYYPVPAEIAALIPGNSTGYGDAGYNMRDNMHMYTDDVYMGDADHPMNVTMDNTPVTSRLDKLVALLDQAVNAKESPKAGPSNAKSLGNGTADKPKTQVKQTPKGNTSVGQHDKLANIHARLAKRTRVGVNYNQM